MRLVSSTRTQMAYFFSGDAPEEVAYKGKATGAFSQSDAPQAPHLGAVDHGEHERFAPRGVGQQQAAAEYEAPVRPTFGKGSAGGAAVRGGNEAASALSHVGADEGRFERRGSIAQSEANSDDYVRPQFGRANQAKLTAAEGAGGTAAAFSHDGADEGRFTHRDAPAASSAPPTPSDGLARPMYGRGSTQGAANRGGSQAAEAFGGMDDERFARNHKPGSTTAELQRPQFARNTGPKDDASGMHGIFGEAAPAPEPAFAQASSPGAASRPWGTHEELAPLAHAVPTPRGEIASANHDHGSHITASMDAISGAQANKMKATTGNSIFG